MLASSLLMTSVTQAGFLADLPAAFKSSPSNWAYLTYPNIAVLPGAFNRSAMNAIVESETSDEQLSATNEFLNTTNFIAYEERFLDIIGPNAQVQHIHKLAYQSHESPCYNPDLKQLFFAEWGPPGGQNGTHSWHYLLNTETNELQKITTTPLTYNAHGCVYFNGSLYVVTDGSHNETGSLVKINPNTLEKTTLLNNYYEQPFLGFNDLDIDPDGNFYLTDSKSAYGRDLTDFYNPTNPTVYFVNGSSLRPKPIHITTGNANGVAVGVSPQGGRILYLPDTGVSEFKPVSKKNPFGDRSLHAFDISKHGVLMNKRFLNNPIAYFYDGIRVSKNGWIFAGSGDGVDVMDPESGLTLGSIRVGGGENLAVSIAFGQNELWIVGRGGVWHVSNVTETLLREW
ncbi:unnamed protein product [Clonostachys chloroleuca]|uniref:SMP-30/Gluconolactonase/LRE-like region domain-containing protein n=1 Tax=Clonostachys chloroleuca TaxID=1926264 RepID=A0AA35M5U9_9HYPO|nr:unnamed protein product [Clonostachys chloroleuca]